MRTRKVFSAIAAAVLMAMFVILTADAVSAQGRYANRYSRTNVSGIISRLETSSDEFSRDFARAMNSNNINRSQAERYNNIVRDFENSVDRLRRNFDSNDSWWQSRNEVQDMVRDARPVNTMMNTLPFRRNLERQWNRLRRDVNTVADTYDLPGLDGGGWTGGGGWGGGNGNAPNWAVGTFYGRDPYTGRDVTLTINQNGGVVVEVDGSPTYGTINGTSLFINGESARVSRLNNGIRTQGRDGLSITYTRTGSGPGGGWGNPGGGFGNAPSWAVGTFYGRNPQGGIITLTINNNGSVTADFGGGSRSFGTLNGDVLTIDGATSRVTRRGNNGIRTTSTNGDGYYIDYSRNYPR